MTIAALAQESAAAARTEFVNAVWSRAEPLQLLRLAGVAGVTPDQADRIVQQIENLRSHEELGGKAHALRAAAGKALASYERKRGEIQSQIDRLESQIGDLAFVAQGAEREAANAENSFNAIIRAFYNDGLVPSTHPFVVSHLAHEHKERAALEAERALRDRVKTALSAVQNNVDMLRRWRDRKNYMLAERLIEQSEGRESWTLSRCKEEIAKGPDAIAASRKELAAAITAAHKAGLVVEDAPPIEPDEA